MASLPCAPIADQHRPAAEHTFAVGDYVKVDGDGPTKLPWRITEIVTDDPQHDGPFAILHNDVGERSWSALRILHSVRSGQCPAWCVMDGRPGDGAVFHNSDIAEVIPTAGAPTERRPYEVSVEQYVRPDGRSDAPTVILDGGRNPMTADEALHLAGLLILAARRAGSR